jgi:hypothetical protein
VLMFLNAKKQFQGQVFRSSFGFSFSIARPASSWSALEAMNGD